MLRSEPGTVMFPAHLGKYVSSEVVPEQMLLIANPYTLKIVMLVIASAIPTILTSVGFS